MELGVCAAAGDGDGDGRVGGGVGVFEGVRDGVVYDVPLGMGALTVECSL